MAAQAWAEKTFKGSSASPSAPWIYDHGGGQWQCQLCQTGIMGSKKVLRAHCNGSGHRKKYSQLLAWMDRRNRRDKDWSRVNTLLPRVEQLKHRQWEKDMKEKLLHVVMSKFKHTDALSLLLKDEQWERLALLELVIWKHCCLADDRFDSMQAIEDYWALEETFDPKEYKHDARHSSEAGIILCSVKSFL